MPIQTFASPPLSIGQAHGLAVAFGLCYVGSIYMTKQTRLGGVLSSRMQNRDDPSAIRARLLAVSTSSLLCLCGTVFLLSRLIKSETSKPMDDMTTVWSAWARLGVVHSEAPLWQAVRPHLVTPMLFCGPLYALFLFGRLPGQSRWSVSGIVLPMVTTLMGVRNYILGPLTEELVFRACVLSVYKLSGVSRNTMIFATPLWFGLAHVHHAWETFNRLGRTPSAGRTAVLSSAFQLVYTSLFGAHAAFLFLRSGSIFPPLTAHIFCNIMGVPQLGWEVRAFPRRRLFIYMAYAVGIVGYVYTMRRWTLVPGSLYWS